MHLGSFWLKNIDIAILNFNVSFLQHLNICVIYCLRMYYYYLFWGHSDDLEVLKTKKSCIKNDTLGITLQSFENWRYI